MQGELPQQQEGSVPVSHARPVPPRPRPAAWARPLAKLSSWFVTVGLSCVRCSRVGNVVCSVVVRAEGWRGRHGHPQSPQSGAPQSGWDSGTGGLQGQVAQAGPAAAPKDLGM